MYDASPTTTRFSRDLRRRTTDTMPVTYEATQCVSSATVADVGGWSAEGHGRIRVLEVVGGCDVRFRDGAGMDVETSPEMIVGSQGV